MTHTGGAQFNYQWVHDISARMLHGTRWEDYCKVMADKRKYRSNRQREQRERRGKRASNPRRTYTL